jgi:Carboxypeptidase regulatory-like domain/TonB dependent receptor-like, beta-barrel
MNRRVISLFALLSLVLVSTQPVYTQVDTGTILGTVKDQSGAVVPQATVTLTNEETNVALTKKSGPDGSFVFAPIPIGTYSISAGTAGFRKATHLGVVVNIQQQTVVDLTLVPGAVTQAVEVRAAPPLLQSQNASVQQVVTTRAINDLPLNGRNSTFLAQISAGVTFGPADNRALAAHGAFSANGARGNQNNYMLDGIDNNSEIGDLVNQSNFVLLPPPDALNEFTVQTNNYSAEFGHSAGAVLNATTKSGTNQLHGDIWEYLRNDKLDSSDFFLNAAGGQKGELRQNQFGFTLGGPVVLPHLYKGHNKTFFFADYQGTRIRSGATVNNSVPTGAERSSGYTNFQDLIAGQSGTRSDLLGRTFPLGTVFDPATTRAVQNGQVDPVTGLTATANGSVRDPFYMGSIVGVTNFTTPTATGLLNLIPAGRLDPNDIKIMNLFPSPSVPGVFNNYVVARVNKVDDDQFGVRLDHNLSNGDRMFFRYVLSNTTSDAPGPYPGLADGQGARPGSGTTKAQNWALSETHIFSPSLINEARIGYSRLHDLRLQYFGNEMGIPEQYGIQGIPQIPQNGGLPRFVINGFGNLGQGPFLPSDKWSNTIQVTDNLTKMAGRHAIKVGVEFQNIRFPMLTPAFPRGQMTYNGVFTSIVNQVDSSTSRAQFLLAPTATTVPAGIDNVGGMTRLDATNFSQFSDLRRNYYAFYGQDDWRATSHLTLNLGLRWEYFDRPSEHYDAMANFVPSPGFQGGQLLFPASRQSEVPQAYIDVLAMDGIKFTPTSMSRIIGNSPTGDFGPRFGFAYTLRPRLVLRGGYAIFYSGIENYPVANYDSYSFPFVVSSSFTNPNSVTPITPDNSIGSLENGLLNVPLSAADTTKLSGILLLGAQRDWKDAGSQNFNFFVQYLLGRETTAKVGYVGAQTHNLMLNNPPNTVGQILPPSANLKNYLFYPEQGQGGAMLRSAGDSNYNGLELDLEHRAGNLYMLGNFTWSKCRSDGRDILINDIGGSRAPYLAGFGIQGDWALCNFDVRRIFHFSGVYDLPFGRGRRFLNRSGVANAFLGGWSTNWILTVQDGQPFTVGCTITTTRGLGCNALLVPGENPYQGQQTPQPFLNAAAFANPPVAATVGQTDFAPLGGAATQVTGPAFHNVDFSLFKKFQTTESTHLEFRAEFFNLTNTPSFASPSSLNFQDTKNFGKITSTRSSPREIQFALKFYF